MKVRELQAVRKQPRSDVIQHLEYLLDLARKGEIRSIAEVIVFDDGTADYGQRVEHCSDNIALCGGLHLLLGLLSMEYARRHHDWNCDGT